MNITKKNQPVIAQIPVSYSKNSEYRELVKELCSKGYEVYHGLDAIEDDDDIIAIIVDNVDKSLFQSNVTCMACWCSGKRQPLNVKEFLSNMYIRDFSIFHVNIFQHLMSCPCSCPISCPVKNPLKSRGSGLKLFFANKKGSGKRSFRSPYRAYMLLYMLHCAHHLSASCNICIMHHPGRLRVSGCRISSSVSRGCCG